HHGVKAFDLVVRLQQLLDEAPKAFRKVIDDFLVESAEELFETKEECIDWARANFQSLVDGSKGGNLLSKYSMLGRFYVASEAIDFLGHGIERILAERGVAQGDDARQSMVRYLHCVMLHTPFAETVEATPAWTSRYDIETWRSDGYVRPLEDYRVDERVRYTTTVEPEKKALILSRVATFGEHPAGLGKFTRTMFARDLRRTMHPADALDTALSTA
ncbi:MAG TPA: hypothetical protein VFV33_26560, partial [Gemmatimonadaceae bacterium]|nr:hypothetical protein [Gemmatimonadaceae bacterium]